MAVIVGAARADISELGCAIAGWSVVGTPEEGVALSAADCDGVDCCGSDSFASPPAGAVLLNREASCCGLGCVVAASSSFGRRLSPTTDGVTTGAGDPRGLFDRIVPGEGRIRESGGVASAVGMVIGVIRPATRSALAAGVASGACLFVLGSKCAVVDGVSAGTAGSPLPMEPLSWSRRLPDAASGPSRRPSPAADEGAVADWRDDCG